MSRPTKLRKIAFMPENRYFVPVGKPKCSLEEIQLKLEEVEAMRLKDIEKLSQEECAKKMHISRQTLQIILDEARRKVAKALTEGMAIHIQGGNYTLNICKYECQNCGNKFDKAYEKEDHVCPKCSSDDVLCVNMNRCCMKEHRKPWCKKKDEE